MSGSMRQQTTERPDRGHQWFEPFTTIGTGDAVNDSLSFDIGYRGEIATDDGISKHGASPGLNDAF